MAYYLFILFVLKLYQGMETFIHCGFMGYITFPCYLNISSNIKHLVLFPVGPIKMQNFALVTAVISDMVEVVH